MLYVLIFITLLEGVIILWLSTKGRKLHYDGTMVLTETDEMKTFSFEVASDTETWIKKDHIVLKVSQTPE